MEELLGQQARLQRVRAAIDASVAALADDPTSIPTTRGDQFASALRACKLDAKQTVDASRPRGMVLAGPGWEAAGPLPEDDELGERIARVRQEVGQALGGSVKRARMSDAVECVTVTTEDDGRVLVGRDSANAWQCVVRLTGANASSIEDVFFLRADEDAGPSWGGRESKFAYWREMTRQAGGLEEAEAVWRFCEERLGPEETRRRKQ